MIQTQMSAYFVAVYINFLKTIHILKHTFLNYVVSLKDHILDRFSQAKQDIHEKMVSETCI